MVKPTRASPATGKAGNGPSPDAIMEALAVEMLDQDALTTVKERRKRNRKIAEGKGVDLGHLDALYKRRDEPASKIEEYFRGLWMHMTAHFTDLADQMDMFVPKAAREAKAAFFHSGMMAGLKGEKDEAPLNLDGDERNEWLKGHTKGAGLRGGAEKSLADTLAAAMKIADAGGVVDGKTGEAVKGARAKAAADAKEDVKPGVGTDARAPEQPDWTGFDEDPMKWEPEQSRIFAVWFDSIPNGAVARISHKGVLAAYRARGGSQPVVGDDFEAPAAELAKQTTRQTVKNQKAGAEDATDPLVVSGVRYPSKTRADAARKIVEGQSEKAARLAAEAGITR